MINILSYGGGVNSTAQYFHLIKKKLPLDLMIFSDTGSELPETYKVIKLMKKQCQKDKVRFVTVKSKLGKLHEYYFSKKALPSRMKRDCTSKFKISPIRSYIRKRYGKQQKFVMYIGISAEEWHRIRKSDVKYMVYDYPLVNNQINREDCIRICKKNGFGEVTKSGCFCCPYTKKQGWMELYNNHPELFQKSIDMEVNCSNKKVTLASIPLEKIKETIIGHPDQLKLADFEVSCDVVGGCFL